MKKPPKTRPEKFLKINLYKNLQKNSASDFTISSSELKANSQIENKYVFDGFGCKGDNISPQISWKNAPKETKSFALTVYDPDAPTGSGWWHWVVLNIPANYNELISDFGKKNKANLTNNITQVRNDFGQFSFGGPCPPQGDKAHRYIFTIYALKTNKIALDKNSSPALAGFMINHNMLAKTSFTAFYGR